MKRVFLTLIVAVMAGVLWWQFGKSDKTTNNAPSDEPTPVYHDVVYDVDAWAISPKTDELNTLIAHLGTPTTDETLDYYGKPATRYRFNAHHEPPLSLIVSNDVLELSWYHAVARDNDEFKNQSQSHAKKAHAVMTAIYGKDGQAFIKSLLAEKDTPTLPHMTHATCQSYQCQIVLNAKTLGIQLPKS